MKNLTVLLLMSLSLVVTGCSDFETQSEVQKALQAVDLDLKVEGPFERPFCEMDNVDYELDMRMLAFELKDRTNFGVGFNLVNGFFRALGLRMKLERGQMLMSMGLNEALRPTENVAYATGRGESRGTEFRFDLDAIQLGLDVGYFYQTPLSQLTRKTLKNNLARLNKERLSNEIPWNSRVVKSLGFDQQVIIPAGSVAGLRLGDEFFVYNMVYDWEETPCESKLLFQRKYPSHAIAKLKVTQLERNASLMTITEKQTDDPIYLGSRVEIAHLPLQKGEKKRSLKHSLRLRNVASEKLVIPNGNGVDLTVYMREQTKAVMDAYGFYPRE